MLNPSGLPPMPAGVAAAVTNEPVAQAPEIAQPVWTQPVRASSVSAAFVWGVVGIALMGLLFLALLGYFALALGPVALVVCAVAALLPLALVLIAIMLIDRWEPEPKGALWFGFLWGAAASIAITLIADAGIQLTLYLLTGGEFTTSDLFGGVVQAPIVEEFAKGVGILLIFFFLRKNFDGPVDGLVYGATVAAGFAFTENILYFGTALIEEGGVGLGITFFLRGIMSPFSHIMFTACTGLALGIASRRKGWLPALGLFLVGLLGAIGLHALWNASAFLSPGLDTFLLLYAAIQMPLFAGAVVMVVLVRRAESRLTRQRLQEYADAGWFTPDEVTMLSTGAGRRRAKAWAGSQGPGVKRAMRSFIRDATALAFTRNRILIDRESAKAHRQEHELLGRIRVDREILVPSVRL